MKKRFLAAVLAALLVGTSLAGCQQGGEASGDTVKIGGLAPLTGKVANYGIATNNGIQLAVKKINDNGGILGGKKIDYIYYDEKGDPNEALTAFNKLVQNDQVVALVGDVTSNPTKAVAQKSVEYNLPMITATGTTAEITEGKPNVFRACFIDPYQGELMASYAADKLGAKSAAILYDNGDSYSSGIADAFEKVAKEQGMTVTKLGYASKSVDFRAQLTQIKGENPDVLLIPCYYEDVALIAAQAKEIGITAKLLGGDGWDGVLDKLDASNVDAVAGCYFCSQYSAESDDPDLQAFLEEYRETYDSEPSMFSVLGYDAMNMMAAAIDKAGSTDPDAIIEALKSIEYKGLTGTTTFDSSNNPVREAVITTVEDGKYKVVETYKK